jgi:hypothetical protein
MSAKICVKKRYGFSFSHKSFQKFYISDLIFSPKPCHVTSFMSDPLIKLEVSKYTYYSC